MPSLTHPRAQFVPLSPIIDLGALVDQNDSFDEVRRIPQTALEEHTVQSLEQLVYLHVVKQGRPLVLEGWGSYLPPWLFTSTWLEQNLGREVQKVRDISNGIDLQMTMGHYLRSMKQLNNQFTPQTYKDNKRQRLYLKDIDCPSEWAETLKDILPEAFFYLNECVESRTGGDGAIREPNEFGQMRFGKGVAPAGDLMSSLPPDMRAMNMMCYIGHEGTYTPAHREMCASLGHNLMVETSNDSDDEKVGSSVWFMTETTEREVVSEYFLSMLGHDIEVENHFAQLNAWRKAPFNVWVTEQKVGDLILIPPLAPHQVWNRGTRTMKVAWNRTTVDTLELAIHEALPRARLVCRDEQYKNKAIIYYTLEKYFGLLSRDTVEPKMWMRPGSRVRQVMEDFKQLFDLYKEVLISELFSSTRPEKNVEFLQYDSNVTCSYCRCNIFNRFLTCKSCILTADSGEEDTYDICMECYAMGRSCACISNMKWVEQFKEEDLRENYELWRSVVLEFEGSSDQSPLPLDVEREKSGKKTVAQICQEQLAMRPWRDITKPEIREPSPGESDVEPEVDDEGRLKKKYKKPSRRGRIKATKNKTANCHICCHHDWNWKLAKCSTCTQSYCYGTLWRAFDLMPQTIMEMKNWQCPRCLNICSCGKCRKDPKQKPYSPKGTLLGHDTKKVADYRSVESLVDFSKTNLGWLRPENEDNPEETTRMKRLKEKAGKEKNLEHSIDNSYLEDGDQHSFFNEDESHFNNNMADIDPQLRDETHLSPQNQSGDLHPTSGAPANGESGYGFGNSNHYQTYDQIDGDHELDDDYPELQLLNEAAPEYPSRLLAPVAPMVGTAHMYPEPSYDGHNRMMGIGYYQQVGNGMDNILYDSPMSEGEPNDPLTINPADLLAPLAQFASVAKKRKRLDSEGLPEDDENDVEFVASKRQRKPAKLKGPIVESDVAPQSEPRPPRRNVVKPTTYAEPPIVNAEDEPEPALSPSDNLEMIDDENADVELATKAFGYFTNGKTGERTTTATPVVSSGKKRGRPRGSGRKSIAHSPSPAPLTSAKTARKSAWLIRKEQTNDHEDQLSDFSATRGRPKRSLESAEQSRTAWQAINNDSVNENSGEDEVEENHDDSWGQLPKKKRGRPRKALSDKSADKFASEESDAGEESNDEADEEEEEEEGEDGEYTKQRAMKRRTRQSAASVHRKPMSAYIGVEGQADEDLAVGSADEISDGSLFGGDVDDEEEVRSFRDKSEHQNQHAEVSVSNNEAKNNVSQLKVVVETPSGSLDNQVAEQGVVKKRRGRPPKKALNLQIQKTPVMSSSRTKPRMRSSSLSKSPPPSIRPSNAGNPFLSLSEKLALKGKKIKIVAKKSELVLPLSAVTSDTKEPSFNAATSARSSIVPSSIGGPNRDASMRPLNTSYRVSSHHHSTSIEGTLFNRPISTFTPPSGSTFYAGSSEPAEQVSNSRLVSPTSRNGSSSATIPRFSPSSKSSRELPVKKEPTVVRLDDKRAAGTPEKKGPTVVRLMDTDSEGEEDDARSLASEQSDSEGWSSSDSDIPAVKTSIAPVNGKSTSMSTISPRRGRPPLRR